MKYYTGKLLFQKLFLHSKWIVLLAVVVLYLSSILLVFIGLLKLRWIVLEIIDEINSLHEIDTVLLSAHFIIIIEIYLLAIVFYIFAIGIYKLFVEEIKVPNWLHLEHIDDLKSHIAKTIVLFLSAFIVQKIAEWKNPEDLLYYGITIAMTSGILIWYVKTLKNNNLNNNPNNNLNNEKTKHEE